MIHPTAIIHPKAQLHSSVAVGAYAIVDEGVEVGPDCLIGPHVHLTGITTIGARNRFHTGCVIGDAPQDLKFSGELTRLRIGEANVFREHVTVHRSNTTAEDTVIGNGNFFMACSHVAHNCSIGNHVILANCALLAGHVTVQDRAFISGNCSVHQFVRVGTLAIMQGGSAISKDLPPFTVGVRTNEICGLNLIGLRRAGIQPAERLQLKKLYHVLFRSGLSMRNALVATEPHAQCPAARTLLQFVIQSKRGCCADTGAAGEDEIAG